MAERYECPNGHPVELVEMLPCNVEGCMAMVAYEPTAHGLALDGQLEALREAVRHYLNGAPLDEHGRFKNARLEPLYRALTRDSSG